MRVHFEYNKVLIAQLKRRLPKRARRWNPDVKAWEIEDRYLYEAAAIIAPHQPKVAQKLMEAPEYAEAREAARDRMKQLEASMAADAEIDTPAPEGFNYYPFQRAGIAFLKEHKGVLLADEMGLGKTIQLLGLINAVDPKSVLIIAPATLKLNWKAEAETWLVRDYKITVVNASDATPVPSGEREIFITNYAALNNHVETWEQYNWDLVGVDECHAAKNFKLRKNKTTGKLEETGSQRGINTLHLIKKGDRRVFITGTPIVNEPSDLWPFISTLRPDYWNSFWSYMKRYANAHRGRWGWDFSGASNLEELQIRLRESVMIRREKTEVVKELPDKVRQIVPVPLEGELASLVAEESKKFGNLKKIMEDMAKGDAEDYEEILENVTRGESVSFHELAALRHKLAVAKVPQVVAFCDHLLENKDKIIIFAHHKDVVNALVDHYGDECVKLVGGMAETAKAQSVKLFQKEPKIRVFVGNIAAAGVGITLTASDTVVFAELDWVPSNLTQAEDRAHRIGQDSDAVFVFHLVAEGSLDHRIATVALRKQKQSDTALNASSLDYATSEGEVKKTIGNSFTALKEQIEQAQKPEDLPPTRYSEREKAHFLVALKILANACDGAVTKDRQGFNKYDTEIGKSLAAQEHLTDKQAVIAEKLVHKYRKQLQSEGLYLFDIDDNEGEVKAPDNEFTT